MDPLTTIDKLGGGLTAIVIVGLASAVAILWRRNNTLQDRMIDLLITNGREAREMQAATNATLSAATQAMEAAVRSAERRS